jgi:putative ABC transport system permease protein
MIAVALRSMGQRKLRSVLTSIAILLGVAMIAGTYVQTDQIRAAFDDILQTANAGVDANITPRTEFRSDFGAAQTMDEALVARASRIPGVARAEGQLSRPARWSSTARRSSRTSRPRSSCR